MENTIYLTQEGLDNIRQELENLKDVERPKNIQALKDARSQGDLSENADYDAAREEQSRIEQRIQEIEAILKNYKLIKANKSKKVEIGKRVTVKYIDNGHEGTYDIVGTIESDPMNNKISNEAPLGAAIIGSKVGDKVLVISGSKKEYHVEILKVE